jgi:hypothetical protein
MVAAFNGNMEEVKAFLKNDHTKADAADDAGYTALGLAYIQGHYDVAALIAGRLEKLKDENQLSQDDFVKTLQDNGFDYKLDDKGKRTIMPNLKEINICDPDNYRLTINDPRTIKKLKELNKTDWELEYGKTEKEENKITAPLNNLIHVKKEEKKQETTLEYFNNLVGISNNNASIRAFLLTKDPDEKTTQYEKAYETGNIDLARSMLRVARFQDGTTRKAFANTVYGTLKDVIKNADSYPNNEQDMRSRVVLSLFLQFARDVIPEKVEVPDTFREVLAYNPDDIV